MKKVALKDVQKRRNSLFGKKNRVKFDKVYQADKLSTNEIKSFLDALIKFKQTPKNVKEMEKLFRFYSLGIPAMGKARWDIKKQKDTAYAVLALPVQFSDLDEMKPLNRFLLTISVQKTKKGMNQFQLEISYDTKNELDGWDIQYFNVHTLMLDDEELTELYSQLDEYFRTNDLMAELQDIYSLLEAEEMEIDDSEFDLEIEDDTDMDDFLEAEEPIFFKERRGMRRKDGSGPNPNCSKKKEKFSIFS